MQTKINSEVVINKTFPSTCNSLFDPVPIPFLHIFTDSYDLNLRWNSCQRYWRMDIKQALEILYFSKSDIRCDYRGLDMSHHIKSFFIDCWPDVMILHHGTCDLSSNPSADGRASRIAALGWSVKNKYNQAYLLGLTMRNDKWEGNEKLVNQLLY